MRAASIKRSEKVDVDVADWPTGGMFLCADSRVPTGPSSWSRSRWTQAYQSADSVSMSSCDRHGDYLRPNAADRRVATEDNGHETFPKTVAIDRSDYYDLTTWNNVTPASYASILSSSARPAM